MLSCTHYITLYNETRLVMPILLVHQNINTMKMVNSKVLCIVGRRSSNEPELDTPSKVLRQAAENLSSAAQRFAAESTSISAQNMRDRFVLIYYECMSALYACRHY